MLSGLTVRGRSLLAAGLACLCSAVALGEEDLVRIGVLLLALPLIAGVVLSRTRLQLRCTRSLEPRRVAAGSLVRVALQLENASRRTTPTLFAEDTSSGADSPDITSGTTTGPTSSRFTFPRLEGGASSRVSYSLRPPRRGVYTLGPLVVRLCDPFGFCELPRTFSSTDRLVVTPEVVPLPKSASPGRWSAGSATTAGGVGASGEDDLGTRPYRFGDELRRVHWRTTARVGELSVRREEQPRQGTVTVLLDTRISAFPPGTGSDIEAEDFETAVSVVASLAMALPSAGGRLRLVTSTGLEVGSVGAALSGGARSSTADLGPVLEVLAELHPEPESRMRLPAPGAIDVRLGREYGSPAASDLVVAVVGRMQPRDLPLLPRSASGAPGLALVVGGQAETASTTALLSSAGWRAAAVPRLSALPLAWSALVASPAVAESGGWS